MDHRKSKKIQKKNIYFFFIDYARAADGVYHNKVWKILNEMGISNQFTRLLRNQYDGQEAIVRIRHQTTDWFKIGKSTSRLYIVTLLIELMGFPCGSAEKEYA